MYDIIGDIHGHADELVELLELLGYERQNSVYKPPTRQFSSAISLIVDRKFEKSLAWSAPCAKRAARWQ